MADGVEQGSDAWFSQVSEDAIDPSRRIVDPHHHLWPQGLPFTRNKPYTITELWDDADGHNVVSTVFVECGACYRTDGPDHLKSVGETEMAAAAAAASRNDDGKPVIAGIVAHTDLRSELLEEALAAHEQESNGLLRGIRHAISSPASLPAGCQLFYSPSNPPGLAYDENFLRGVRMLGEKGLTYESWLFHTQLKEFLHICKSAPNTTIILDHFGTPVNAAAWDEAQFNEWKLDINAIAACSNVYAKLGGLVMPDNGFGFHAAARPPTSDEFVAAQGRFYRHAISAFGADRCMFESNFPVDKLSIAYKILWNAFKKIAAEYSDEEQEALFWGTASKVYRLH